MTEQVPREALAPVLRDLEGAGIPGPQVEDDDGIDDPGVVSAALLSPDDSVVNVDVLRSASQSERIAGVADQIQEWAIHELWPEAATNWPVCPRHPTGPAGPARVRWAR